MDYSFLAVLAGCNLAIVVGLCFVARRRAAAKLKARRKSPLNKDTHKEAQRFFDDVMQQQPLKSS